MDVLDRLSFQLYSARKFPPLDKQLATLAALGFRNVELYGALLDDHAALKAALERHHLKAPSSHVGIERLRTDRRSLVRQAQGLGIRLLIAPAISPEARPNDAEGWRGLGRELADLKTALAADGIDLAWHNHDFEFRKLADGSYPLDRMFAAAPGLPWEADIGWLVIAGEDPLAWLKKYRERLKAVHIKDVARAGERADEDGWTDIGEGVVNWPRLLPAIEAAGVELLVLEHDNPADYESFARQSLAAMQSW